ncbi:MAG: DUF5011 domain-containing protein, partial [Gammaproteobacteria bacterium]|nr:DUF5011 domain-containing protein [Gammaproteobacteria bacterium]
ADTEVPVITLSGSTPVNVEIGTAYNDAGATASDNVDGNITASIITTGLPIDTNTPGNHIVTYDVTDSSGNTAIQVTRTVNVTDTEIPVITLSGSTPVNVEVGTAYNDAGATASDNIDGNITASIVAGSLPIDTSTPGSYIVTYDVTDSSGNAAVQVTRTVNVTDTEIPVITLSGSTPVNVDVGTAYNDAGATASDNVDGNITASIVTGGLPINTSTPDSYTVTYDVTDSSGNAAVQVTRIVNVTVSNDDTDGDCLPDIIEEALGLDPFLNDTDGDGVLDGDEDYDHDGFSNCDELNYGTNLQIHDTDGDGFIDGYENARSTDANNIASIPIVNLYVNPLAGSGGDGTLGNPFNTIQDALDAALDNDLIQLAAGTYTGIGNKDLNYTGKPLMLISGNGAENCIIDCEGAGRGFVFENGEGPLSILAGVTIQNGNSLQGGGIYCFPGNPTIMNCTITDNSANYDGGGIYIRNSMSSPVAIHNCKFEKNVSNFGGGIHIRSSSGSVTIRNCTITDNSANYDGGGILLLNNNNSSTVNVQNCAITKNSANGNGSEGGGIYHNSSGANKVNIHNCTIVENIANYGGGLDSNFYSFYINNSILWANTGRLGSPYSGIADVTYSLVQDGWVGEGNIDVDPQFVTNGFQIKSNSPCVDTGSDEYAFAKDIDGEFRWDHPNIVNVISSVDIGADEFVDTDGDNMADIWEMKHFGDLSHDGSSDSDGDGFTDIEEYENGTNPNNIDPIIISTPITTATVDILYQYDVDATDGYGGISQVFSLTQNPPSMTVDSASGIISWIPDPSDVGTHPVSVNVDDGNGGSATQSYNITVSNAVDTTAPIITLLGSTPVDIEVGTAYNDAGATASDNVDGNITTSIVTTGLPIDTSTPGSYIVTYDVTDFSGNAAIQVTRTVNVSDTEVPVITLSGSTPVNVEVGTAYNDAGATASDNVDGNITASIIITGLPIDTNTPGSHIVTYNVTDSSGNAATQVTRTVNVTDTEIPIITLSGSTPVNVEVGAAYNDAGATASDNVDGNITASIVTGGLPIDTSTPGSHIVTYDVTDSSGNAAVQVTRTVNVTDTEIPVITLSGSTPVNVEVGAAYNDAGATADDNVDGNITASIVTG